MMGLTIYILLLALNMLLFKHSDTILADWFVLIINIGIVVKVLFYSSWTVPKDIAIWVMYTYFK